MNPLATQDELLCINFAFLTLACNHFAPFLPIYHSSTSQTFRTSNLPSATFSPLTPHFNFLQPTITVLPTNPTRTKVLQPTMPWVYQGHTLGSKEFPPEFTPPYIDLNYDIDGFNYTVSPSELVDTFGKLTQVTLGFHDPRLRDIPYYANWVVLGTGPAVLKVCARFKDLVLQAYQGSHTL